MKTLLNAVFCAALIAAGGTAYGQFPSAPVKIVVAYPPGALGDTLPRMVAEKLRAEWGQPVIIENRPGANARIGTEYVAKAPADGHTLLVALPDNVILAPLLYRNVPYDTMRDFTPVGILAKQGFDLVVRSDLPANTVADLIRMAKADPGKLRMSSWGEGSTSHLALEWLKMMSGTDILHVPYKGAQAAMTDLLGGRVDLMIVGYSIWGPHIKNGRVRVIAQTSARRSPLWPNVPTVAESGYAGYDIQSWWGLIAPRNTPQSVIHLISASVARAIASADIRERIAGLHAEAGSGTPEEFSALLSNEQKKWSAIVRDAKIQLE